MKIIRCLDWMMDSRVSTLKQHGRSSHDFQRLRQLYFLISECINQNSAKFFRQSWGLQRHTRAVGGCPGIFRIATVWNGEARRDRSVLLFDSSFFPFVFQIQSERNSEGPRGSLLQQRWQGQFRSIQGEEVGSPHHVSPWFSTIINPLPGQRRLLA